MKDEENKRKKRGGGGKKEGRKGIGKGREGGERIRSSSVDIEHSKFQNRNTTKDPFIIIKEATGQETTGNKQKKTYKPKPREM